ncbi:MAG: discoidin domain-containing protein [Candidatus Nitrotoga sp.]|nr:discoidin domain-containing protein [Candidatus Nitrotoga sp.]
MQIPELSNSREVSPLLRSISLFCLALLATAAATEIAWTLFSTFITTPSAADVIVRYGLRTGARPESVENATFLFAWFFAALSISLAVYLSVSECGRKILVKVPPHFDFGVIAVTCIGAALWLWWMDWTSLVPPSPSALLTAVRTYPLSFVGSVSILAILIIQSGRWSQLLKWRYLALIAAVVPLALLSRQVISSTYDETTAFWHYQLIVHPIVQAWLGSGIYLNQESLYGFYPVFLLPLWHLLGPPNTTLITVVMASLLFFANASFVAFMFRFNRYKGLAVAFALLAIIFTLQFYPFWPGDSYFQFFPLRLVFPAIALVLMCFRVTSVRFPIISYLLLSFGVFWNFETGTIALVSFGVFAVFVGHSPQWRILSRLVLRHAAMAACGLIISFLVISGYYQLQFGALPDWSALTKYIQIYASGVHALPMPMWGAWIIPVVIFLGALFVGLRSLFTPHAEGERERYAALLAIAVMGILFSKYYQNRSVPLQLIFASWPTFLCLGFLVDIGLSRLQKSATRTAEILAAALAAPLMSALFLYSINNPAASRDWSVILEKKNQSALDVTVDAIANIFSQVRRRENDEILVVAPYVDLFQLKIGKPNPLPSPFHCSFEFHSEIRSLVAELRKETTRMVVFDFNSFCNNGALNDEPSVALAIKEEFQPLTHTCSMLGTNSHAFVRRDPISAEPALARYDGANLALGKAANQSSQFGLTGAAAAVDGNSDGAYGNGSVTHTLLDKAAWWELDLGASVTVTSLAIWNRTDFGSERLKNYWVFVSDTPFVPSDTPAILKDRSGVWSSFQTASPCPSTRIAVNSHGRYVRVQLAGEDYLSLAEVQVFGTPGAIEPSAIIQKSVSAEPTLARYDGPNLALGKPATQSSQFGLTGAATAVDGNTDGTYGNGSVTHTLLDKAAWWEVDLGASAMVVSLAMWNRTDYGSERLKNYWVFVSDTPFVPSDTPATLKDRSGVWSSFQASPPQPSARIAVNSHGRYVRVQLAGEDYLSLTEVQVFGTHRPIKRSTILRKTN